MEPPDPSFADEFNVPQEDAVLVFDVRRAAVSLPFQVHRLKVLVEAGLVAFLSACFEFANEVPKRSSARQPCAPSDFFSSHLHDLSKVAVLFPRILSLLPCCVHFSFHTGPRAPNLCSAGALRARYQLCRSGKHDVGHVSGNATDAGAIGDWW